MGIVRPFPAGIVAVGAFLALLPAPAEAAVAGGGLVQSTACKYRSPGCRWSR